MNVSVSDYLRVCVNVNVSGSESLHECQCALHTSHHELYVDRTHTEAALRLLVYSIFLSHFFFILYLPYKAVVCVCTHMHVGINVYLLNLNFL